MPLIKSSQITHTFVLNKRNYYYKILVSKHLLAASQPVPQMDLPQIDQDF
jgi:hypothetical protein